MHSRAQARTSACAPPPPRPSVERNPCMMRRADVIVRQDLLLWLRKECEDRGATIVYATHIFDGLDDWPTHLTYMKGYVAFARVAREGGR